MKISLNNNHLLESPIRLFAQSIRDVVVGGSELYDIFVSNDLFAIKQRIQQRITFPNHYVIRARTLVVCDHYDAVMHDLCNQPNHDVYFYIAPQIAGIEYDIASHVVDLVLAGGLPFVYIRNHVNNTPLVSKCDIEVDYEKLANELRPFMNTKQPTQICINSANGNSLTEGAGKQRDDSFEVVCDTHINHQFKGGYIEEVRNVIREKYVIGRVRLMRIDPKSNYTFHADTTTRLHIPLKTNNQAFLLAGGRRLHLPLSRHPFIINTRLVHTAMNGAPDESRYHLVAVLLKPR